MNRPAVGCERLGNGVFETESLFRKFSNDFIVLQSRLEEEESAERYPGLLKTDDEA